MTHSSVAFGSLCSVLVLALAYGWLFPPDASVFAREPEGWACDIDLHQGDTGRMEFTRTEAGIQGSLTVGRQAAGRPQPSTIKGSWGREVIRFNRTLASRTEEPFIGIATGTDGRQFKMAGRFGAGFNGVWSATCASGATVGSVDPGVRPVPPTPPSPAPVAGSCAISIDATGPRADLAKIYQLVLRGPDSMTIVKARQSFGSGHVTFSDLPDGRYLLTLDTKADVSVSISPRRHEVVCSGGAPVKRVFEFR